MRAIDTRVGGTISKKLNKKEDAHQALTRATWACVCKSTQHIRISQFQSQRMWLRLYWSKGLYIVAMISLNFDIKM